MKPITNQSGRVIAYTQEVSPCRQEIRDRSNALLGHYNPKADKTFDRKGNVVSNSGDTRGTLIPPSE
jgi:hypothetical protein